MDSVCVIGDVHGCLQTLQALIQKLPNKNLCFVGDLIDRGPDSAGVIRLVRENGWDCVQGNHELMSYGFEYRHDWTHPQNGGDDTLASYDHLGNEQWESDREWIKTLSFVKEYPDLKNADDRSLIVTHSGIFDKWCLTNPDELVWNRKKPMDMEGKFNIFGHTPVLEPQIEKHYALIDTGAFLGTPKWKKKYPKVKGTVGLTAFQFPEMKTFFQKTID
jgi:serine/threonine protein phosphatase 1